MSILRALIVGSSFCLLAACGGGGSDDPAPSLGNIGDIDISANESSAPVSVNVLGGRNVSLTATSDNPMIIADDGIAVSGTGTEFSLVLTPVSAALGVATITVVATDDRALSDQAQFQVTVNPQQVSFQAFVRDVFADSSNGEPRDVTSREFQADAQNDDFIDLLN